MAICCFCRQDRTLCDSHAIPNAFFKSIFRNNNGKAIVLAGGKEEIRHTNKSGKAKLLCKECEDLFNRKYDQYLVKTINILNSNIIREGFCARVSVDSDQIARSIASICWRSCVSDAPMYQKMRVSCDDLKNIYSVMTCNNGTALKMVSVRINRLSDPQIDQNIISDFIYFPEPHKCSANGKSFSHTGFSMVIHGFLVNLFMPRLPYNKTRQPCFLKHDSKVLHAPSININSFPPIRNALVSSVEMYNSGLVSQSVKNRHVKRT